MTADQQKENAADRELTQKIRRALVQDKTLSTYAHNVKVIAQGRQVTLKGPVRSEEEKKTRRSEGHRNGRRRPRDQPDERRAGRPKTLARRSIQGDSGDAHGEKKTAVFGIYPTVGQAERAVDALVTDRLHQQRHLRAVARQDSTRDFAHEKHTKAPEGTTTGAAAGGTIGGTLGLLAGIGALAIPGVGPFIAAGPIMGALAGLGVGGAVGGLVGALVGMGIPEYEAKRYEGRVKDGGVLLSVHSRPRTDHARQGDPEADRRGGHLVVERGRRRGPGDRDAHRDR